MHEILPGFQQGKFIENMQYSITAYPPGISEELHPLLTPGKTFILQSEKHVSHVYLESRSVRLMLC